MRSWRGNTSTPCSPSAPRSAPRLGVVDGRELHVLDDGADRAGQRTGRPRSSHRHLSSFNDPRFAVTTASPARRRGAGRPGRRAHPGPDRRAGDRADGRRGPAALTLRRLARELGVEAPALYWHFADKGELCREVVRTVGERLEVCEHDTAARRDAGSSTTSTRCATTGGRTPGCSSCRANSRRRLRAAWRVVASSSSRSSASHLATRSTATDRCRGRSPGS